MPKSLKKITKMRFGPVILNNTPLVALWILDRFDLLRELYSSVVIPHAVEAKFLAVDEDRRRAGLHAAPWIESVALTVPAYAHAFSGLDLGEAEVLALALETSARLVVVDERRGRAYARRLGLSVTGTLGILLAAKTKGCIPQVEPLIAELLANQFYLHASLVSRTLATAGEANPEDKDGTRAP